MNATQEQLAEVAAVFDAAIAGAENADQRAMRELLKQYFCNPEFKKQFTDFMWKQAETR